ncbi:hypothetical protein [Devosia sediminis]|uniref:Nucleotide exchange factor GrpE n=1 Tax=Devosia sediminis TaxID=2798801 RepID=A0A934J075_9HYPH|nr:hypothetical protein [Devosia sediminis]MBJ3786355.1 hypothetical protein [Devosia sediminis]
MNEAIDDRTVDMAELAAEFWKLLRNYERVVEAAPENQKAGLVAQARYGSRRLVTILERHGMHVETFDGVAFSTNLPVAAVNADDFAGGDPVVEQTLEPAIILGTTVIKTGRVFLRAEQT